ncbi:MAG TPA: pyruvate synthase subunit PorB [Polyangia bacterium]|jgi:pyruvate ferredoxin oxidoreductase beta subunit
MEPLNVYAARLFPRENYLTPGHRACQGCGEVLAVRLVHQVLGRNTIVASATGCMEIISSSYPDTAWAIPWIHVAFENAAAVASGVETALKVLARKGRIAPRPVTVVGMGGDGGTADIGLQALSGALERGHDMIYVCYDNEAYMNTGIQRSSSTPFGAATTTSPAGPDGTGQRTWKKNVAMIAAAHDVPYVATANPSYPFDLMQKVRKAAATAGPAYLHIYSSCPTGWRLAPELAVAIGRLAVETGVFPLYEIEHGKLRLTVPTPELRPLRDYLAPQGRFKQLKPDAVAAMAARVQREYRRLERREGLEL